MVADLPKSLDSAESPSIATSGAASRKAKRRCLSSMESTTNEAAESASPEKPRGSPQDSPGDKNADPIPLSVGGNSDSTKSPMSTQLTNSDASAPKREPSLTPSEERKLRDKIDLRIAELYMGRVFRSTAYHDAPASLNTIEEIRRWKDQFFFGSLAHPRFIMNCFSVTLGQQVWRFTNSCLPNFKKLSSLKTLDMETQNRLKVWAPKAEQCLGEEYDGHNLLMRAWTWRTLFENLFSQNCRDKWAGPQWADYDRIRRGFQERVANESNSFTHSFHAWRFHHVRMLYATQGPHVDHAWLSKVIRDKLSPLLKIAEPEPEVLDELIDDLVECAIKVDFCAHASKGAVSFEMRDPETLKLSDFVVKDGSDVVTTIPLRWRRRQSRLVDFILRPRMKIYGIEQPRLGDGQFHYNERYFDDYDKYSTVPMEVVVSQSEVENQEQDVKEKLGDVAERVQE